LNYNFRTINVKERGDAHLGVSGEKVAGVQVDGREFPGAVELKSDVEGLSCERTVEPADPSTACTYNTREKISCSTVPQ
jgi:hypothetical protein